MRQEHSNTLEDQDGRAAEVAVALPAGSVGGSSLVASDCQTELEAANHSARAVSDSRKAHTFRYHVVRYGPVAQQAGREAGMTQTEVHPTTKAKPDESRLRKALAWSPATGYGRRVAELGGEPSETQSSTRLHAEDSKMSKRINTFTVVVLALFIAGSALAGESYQSTATASATPATAVIVAPISIVHSAHLNFGEIVASATAGTVILSTAGQREATGGVTLANDDAGSYPTSAAGFTVGGSPNNSYAITLPQDNVVYLLNGEHSMGVNGFQSSKEDNIGTLSGIGGDTFSVGATLSVGTLTDNPTGLYQGSFDVTVTYE
jgi:hypothetical protein